MSSTPNMTLLLNKTEALLDAKAGTLKELSKHLGKREQQVAEWVRSRLYTPNGEVAMAMFHWVSERTIAVAMAGRKIQNAYSAALNKIMKEHPITKE